MYAHKDFIKALNERVIALPPVYIRFFSSVITGLLYAQLMFWFSNTGARKIYKTDAEIIAETGLTVNELRNAKKILKEKCKDFLKISREGLPARTFYEFDWDKKIEVFNKFCENHATSLTQTTLVETTKPVQGNSRIINSEIHVTSLVNSTKPIIEKIIPTKEDNNIIHNRIQQDNNLYIYSREKESLSETESLDSSESLTEAEALSTEKNSLSLSDETKNTNSTKDAESLNNSETLTQQQEFQAVDETAHKAQTQTANRQQAQSAKRFIKPTLEQVAEYVKAQGYTIDPAEFWDYYEMTGWQVGKNKPMKDWQSAVRLWSRKAEQFKNPYTRLDDTTRSNGLMSEAGMKTYENGLKAKEILKKRGLL